MTEQEVLQHSDMYLDVSDGEVDVLGFKDKTKVNTLCNIKAMESNLWIQTNITYKCTTKSVYQGWIVFVLLWLLL